MADARQNRTPAGQKSGRSVGNVSGVTMAVVALIALVVGFYFGFVIKGVTDPAGQVNVSSMPQAQPGKPSGEEQGRISSLEARVESNPDDTEAWVNLGNKYFDTNQYEKSIRAYERALELDPSNANVWTDLGVMYRNVGRPEKAIECFDTAVEVDPEHQTARFNKGIVLLHDLDDREGALESWEELVRINPMAQAPGGQPVSELIKQFRAMPGN